MKLIYTLDYCKKESLKYKTRKELREKDYDLSCAIYRFKYNKYCFKHMPIIKYHKWTPKLVMLEALKYKNSSDWEKNSGSYQAAIKKKNLNLYNSHMKGKKFRSFQSLLKESSKYKTKTEWSLKNSASYQYARRKGLINLCCTHMPILRKNTKKLKIKQL